MNHAGRDRRLKLAITQRQVEIEWTGPLVSGSGTVSLGSHAFAPPLVTKPIGGQ